MRQRRAFRIAGRTARELDIDRIVGLQLMLQRRNAFTMFRGH